mmetsp:Transcript_38383/g.83375  ORF Transcript_38383/g.83375 Transcript_38383/m.83375 type:complete len:604 (-) Transcript_38383:100-1911(-)
MALQFSSVDSMDPADTDHDATCLRTVRNEANAVLSRLSAKMATIDDGGRLVTLRDELNSLLSGLSESESSVENEELTPVGMGSLGKEILVRVLDFLSWNEILVGRVVCTTWRDTARHARPEVYIGGYTGIELVSRLTSLRSVLPMTQELEVYCTGIGEISSIRPVVGFKHLRSLGLTEVGLSGFHPYLFQMPTLEVLKTASNEHFEWDLEALSGLPLLKRLYCYGNQRLTGSLRRLSSICGTLTHVDLEGCVQVTGTLADIGDLCHTLVQLDLERCEQVTGTLNDLRGFKSLEAVSLEGSGVEADISKAGPGDFCAIKDVDVIMLQALTRRLDSTSNHFVLSSVTHLDLSEFEDEFDVDLGLVSFFPNLQELRCECQSSVKGSVRSLRVLRPNLVELSLTNCSEVTGALSDLRDFPKLKKVDLKGTKVTPDMQNIGPNDFPSLSDPMSDICVLRLVSDVPAFMRFLFEKKLHDFHSTRSIAFNSPDSYHPNLRDLPGGDGRKDLSRSPFKLQFVKVGPRVGWRWTTGWENYYFETNWLDPQPLPSDDGYSEYCQEVESKTKENLGPFRGLQDPPATDEEYKELAAAFIRYPRAFARSVRRRIE